MKVSQKTRYIFAWVIMAFLAVVVIGLMIIYGWMIPVLKVLHPVAVVFAILYLFGWAGSEITSYRDKRTQERLIQEELISKQKISSTTTTSHHGLPRMKTMKNVEKAQ